MNQGPRQSATWRIFDVVCSAAGLLLLLPVLSVIALLIWWDDGSPVIFRQTRMGRHAKPFQILKFRTMRVHAPGLPITAAGDSRVTRVGRSLRKFKLDELPQLWNVLTGDMSLIGPRPEVPEFVEPNAPEWQAVLSVRPGITDLATLVCRNEEQVLGATADPAKCYRETILPAKLKLNLEYQRSRSVIQDVRLLIFTVRYSLFPSGFDPIRLSRTFLLRPNL